MEPSNTADWIFGGLAIAIALGGLVMLLSGVRGMTDRDR